MLKRTRSENNILQLQKVKQQKQICTTDFLRSIENLQKPELENLWKKEEKEFWIFLIDTSCDADQVAECLSNLSYPGKIYLLRVHGGLLSYPFFKKIENGVTKNDIKSFFCHTGFEKHASPTYMTMYWLCCALQRNKVLEKATKILVFTNNIDNPFDTRGRQFFKSYDFTTNDGHPLSYNINTKQGRRIQAALVERMQVLLSFKWTIATCDKIVYKKFVNDCSKEPVHVIYAKDYKKLHFRLSKALEDIPCFQPSLVQGQSVFLDRSDSEMENYFIMDHSFDNKTLVKDFLRTNKTAIVLNNVTIIKQFKDENGKYSKLVKGCSFQTSVGVNYVRYIALNKVKVWDPIVTLKRNNITKNTNYLLRPCDTKYRVEREEGACFVVKELNKHMKVFGEGYMVPKSYICDSNK